MLIFNSLFLLCFDLKLSNQSVLENRAENSARAKEELHFLGELKSALLLFTRLFVNLFQVTYHNFHIKLVQGIIKVAHKDFIRNTNTVHKQDNLSIQISLGKGGSSDNLERIFRAFEFYHAGSQFNKSPVLTERGLAYQSTFGATKSNLIGCAKIESKFFIHKLS